MLKKTGTVPAKWGPLAPMEKSANFKLFVMLYLE